MSRSPLVVLSVVGALGAVFALCTALLIRREERRGAEPEPSQARTRRPKAPRVRAPKPPRLRTPKPPGGRAPDAAPVRTPGPPTEAVPPETRTAAVSEPDLRRPSLVDNLDAFTQIRSR